MRHLLLTLCLTLATTMLHAQQGASSYSRLPLTPQDQMNAKFAKQEQTLREIQIKLNSIASRLDAIDQRQEALSSRIKALEKGAQFASKEDLTALRVDLNALRASQEEMHGAIVDEISGKMTKLINTQRETAQKKAEEAKAKSGYEHIVEAGQTISAIAAAYKVPTKLILKANHIKDPTKIRVGQKLFIPDP